MDNQVPRVPVGHSTNLVGVPTGLLASAAFNDHPLRLSISGVRETNRALFDMLEEAGSAAEAVEAFGNYMRTVFGLDEEARARAARAPGEAPPRRFRSSFARLLQGWGFDANGREGAVLKGWVESRFGILPTFHKVALGRYPSAAWMEYVEQKMAARFHNNAIHAQLDLLYEYCQWMLARHHSPARRHIRLYRGVNDFAEHEIVARLTRREVIARQNNLVSFSARRELADQFGDTILEADVPVVKILFYNDLLTRHPLKGEGEFLVIGGDYRVKFAYL